MNFASISGSDQADRETRQLEVLIASVVEVTKQRERIALDNCFSLVISRLTDAKSLTIYHLHPKDEAGEILVVPALHLIDGAIVSTRRADVRPYLLSSRPLIAETICKPYVGSEHNTDENVLKELILPLQGARDDISAYCSLENARNDANTRRVLPLLLEFYKNFLSLLDDNERDALTGLLNRKTFDMHSARIIAILQNQQKRSLERTVPIQFCLAALDIDCFKRINDTFGHIYGDEVLLLFSNIMKKTFRGNDLLFRFGGEEFVVLLVNTDVEHSTIALERFRSAVENHSFPQVGKVTVSIGVASISYDEMPRITMDHADQALYFAKQSGRNQVRIYEELVKQGLIKEQFIKSGDIELF